MNVHCSCTRQWNNVNKKDIDVQKGDGQTHYILFNLNMIFFFENSYAHMQIVEYTNF